MPKTLGRGNLVQNKSKENEIFLAVNELQKLSNSVYRAGPLSLSTSDAATHTIWTSDAVSEGAMWSVTVYFTGHVAAGAGQIFWVRNVAFFRQSGGGTTLVGVTDSVQVRSDGNFSVSVNVSGNAIAATVSDDLARAINWSVWIEVRVSV